MPTLKSSLLVEHPTLTTDGGRRTIRLADERLESGTEYSVEARFDSDALDADALPDYAGINVTLIKANGRAYLAVSRALGNATEVEGEYF
jgi:hypothetical protein